VSGGLEIGLPACFLTFFFPLFGFGQRCCSSIPSLGSAPIGQPVKYIVGIAAILFLLARKIKVIDLALRPRDSHTACCPSFSFDACAGRIQVHLRGRTSLFPTSSVAVSTPTRGLRPEAGMLASVCFFFFSFGLDRLEVEAAAFPPFPSWE